MKISSFEDLIAWQKAQELTVGIYKSFNECKDWVFRNQICKAALSISNNIAEGFDRYTNKEFINFLIIARASCGEVKSMLYLADKLGFLTIDKAHIFICKSAEVSKMINGLIKVLKNTQFQNKPISKN